MCAAGRWLMPCWHPIHTTVSLGWPICARLRRSRCMADRERTLPMTDPWFRQIVVSQGTFWSCWSWRSKSAASTHRCNCSPQGTRRKTLDDKPVACPHLDARASAPAPDPLFAQVFKRHTAKVDYDTAHAVAPDTLAITGRGGGPTGEFGATVQAQQVQELRRICWESARWRYPLRAPCWRSAPEPRGAGADRQHRDGISIMSPMARLADAIGQFDRDNAPAPDSSAFQNCRQAL